MAASSGGKDEQSSLTWFPAPPGDENTQTSRFSFTSWFRKGKDSQTSAKAGDKTSERRPSDLPIRKSELEYRQEEEDLEAEREGSFSSERRSSDGRLKPEGPSRGLLPRSLSPLVGGGSKRDLDQSMSKTRSFEASVSGPVVNYTRSLTTVLKHLSSLVERKGQDPTTYSDSSLRQYWMPDSQCKECYDCGEKFTTFRRRHHCRLCGQIFCSRCCNQEVSGKVIGFIGNLRVCTYCCKVVLSYAQSAYTGDFKELQEDLMTVTEASTPSLEDTVLTPRKKFLGFMDDDMRRTSRAMSIGSVDAPSSSNLFEVLPDLTNSTETQVSIVQEKKLLNSAQLRDLWVLIKNPNNGIMFQNHRYRLRTYPDCIIGSELVDWLLQKDKAAQRVQAVAIGQALLDAKWLKCVTSSYQVFHDEYALYSQGEVAENQNLPAPLDLGGENPAFGEFMEPVWFREIHQDDDVYSEDDLLDRKSTSEAVTVSHHDTLSVDLPAEEHDGNAPSRQKYNSSPIPSFKLELETGTHEIGHKEGLAGGPWQLVDEDISGPNTAEGILTDSFGGTSPINQPSPGLAQSIPWSYEMPEPGLASQDKTGDLVLETIRNEASRILVTFLDQQLRQEGLDPSWGEKILPLAKKICSMVKPNVAEGDFMDIRYYVHIKRVPGGTRSECCLVKGVICTKNVAHKKMAQKQNNPRILILQAAIEHQRVQNKFASLEPLALQEHNYLKNCVSKIVALKPSVLVVEKSVARLAQDFLLACGITLVLSVKPRVVARITRQTEGSSITTIDQVSAAKLGTCQNFHLQKYNLPGGFTKTLMFFDGCPGHLGCSVLLRGGSLAELSKVKRVLNLMVYAVYHSRLETAYLKDEFAMPPLTPSPVVSPPSGSPPNSPPSPMGQTPGRQAIKDTGTIHEVIKAVRIEQALIRKPSQGSMSSDVGEKEKGNVAIGTPPLSRSRFKATVQKLLMGKGSEGSDHSGSNSAAGSRRGSDGNTTGDKTDAAEGAVEAKVNDKKEIRDGTIRLPHVSSDPSFASLPKSGNMKKDAKGSELQGQHDSSTEEGVSRLGIYSCSSITTSESGILQEYVLVGESQNNENANSHSGSLDVGIASESVSKGVDELKEIKVKDYQVEKLTNEEEEEHVFSFDVTGNDSEAEEAVESIDGTGSLKPPSYEDSAADKEDKERFSKAFNNTILTISPFLTFPEPYFETEEGRHSSNRYFFPRNVFWSPKFNENSADVSQAVEAHLEEDHLGDVVYWSTDRCTHKISSMSVLNPHPFTFTQLTEDFWSESTRTLLADFRARGGRYIPKNETSCTHSQLPKPLMAPHDHNPYRQQNTSQQYLLARKGNEDTQESQSQHPIYDCLDPYHHQKILLQFSSYSHHSGNLPGHCIHPWIVTMEFYGRNDITLGMFLDRYCFSANYLCPSETCDTLMASHVRRFVHGNASIQVLQRQLDSPVPGYKNKVLMWSWCRKCKQVTPVQPMSRDTWHMSFAKYLEIHFYGKDYGRHGSSSPCSHSLHHHHYQYFGQHNMVASFKFSPIILREIAFPPLPITIEQPFRAHKSYLEESKSLAVRGSQVFRGISGTISSLTLSRPNQHVEQKEQEFIIQYEADYNRFKQYIDEVEIKVTQVEMWKASPDKKRDSSGNDWSDFCLEDQLLDIEDSIVIAKRCLAEINFSWNTRFHDFLQQEKELEKARKREGSSLSRKASSDLDTPTPTRLESKSAFSFGLTPPLTPMLTLEQSSPVFVSPLAQDSSISKAGGLAPPKRLETLHEKKKEEVEGRPRDDSDVSMLGDLYLTSDMSAKFFDYGISPGLNAGLEYKPSEPVDIATKPLTESSLQESMDLAQGSLQGGQRLVTFPPRAQAVDSRKGDLEKSCETVVTSSEQATQGFSVGEETFSKNGERKDEEKGTGIEESEKSISCPPAEEPMSGIASSLTQTLDISDAGESVTTVASSLTQSLDMNDSKSPAKAKPGAVKGFLNQFLQHTGPSQIETPFPPDEHHTLPPCSVIPVIVYDKEPSSIIAYALSSEQYKTKLYEVQQSRSGSGRLTPGGNSIGSAQGNSNPESGQSSPHTRRKAGGDGRTGGAAGPETKDLSRKIGQLKRRISQGVLMFQRSKTAGGGGANQGASKEGGVSITIDPEDDDAQDRLNPDDKLDDQPLPHIELQFSDETNTQFFCGVYFAAQFQELRKVIFPVGEDIFIRSLSRCMQWVARGGKSGSKFMKTMDDRLILKQMSKSEAHSFLNFAPNYFHYIQKAYENNKPTALAKILGFYKVGFYNPVTNTAQKLDLLVQENLFYKRRIAQVFDLKGSVRNRHVKTSGVQTQDLVLLDENLLKHIIDSPLYIRMHSKTALAMAIKADTEFLSSHLVMDYSLLVGLDENTKELVIGIIDFIRTFTWDKKLETFVKSTSGKMPTVVSPELYRSRFLEAMDKYFLLVPDRWTGLGQDAYSNS